MEKRFAFYDQIHTTGMDIRHGLSARAALTLGKDMVFRDLAQGAFRMRGIGEGQYACREPARAKPRARTARR